MNQVDLSTLRGLLRYEAETGKLFWLPRTAQHIGNGRNGAEVEAIRWNTKWSGKEAFTSKNGSGYLTGNVFRKFFSAHRIAWALYYGEWPKGDIDHINGVRHDNRIDNLRDVSGSANNCNTRIRKDNKTGCTGVFWRKDGAKWAASIRLHGKISHLGFFKDKAEAIAARKNAEKELGFHENHGRTA